MSRKNHKSTRNSRQTYLKYSYDIGQEDADSEGRRQSSRASTTRNPDQVAEPETRQNPASGIGFQKSRRAWTVDGNCACGPAARSSVRIHCSRVWKWPANLGYGRFKYYSCCPIKLIPISLFILYLVGTGSKLETSYTHLIHFPVPS